MRVLVFLLCLSVLTGCGVRIVRPVTLESHKRPTFDLKKINKIAVLEASKGGQEQVGAADIMSLKLLDHGFNVIERSKIRDVMEENKLKIKDDQDVRVARELGKLLNVNSIMIMGISELTQSQQNIPGRFFKPPRIETVVSAGITARLVDIQTSEVIWVGAATTQDKSMQKSLMRISNQMIANITDKKIDDEED